MVLIVTVQVNCVHTDVYIEVAHKLWTLIVHVCMPQCVMYMYLYIQYMCVPSSLPFSLLQYIGPGRCTED